MGRKQRGGSPKAEGDVNLAGSCFLTQKRSGEWDTASPYTIRTVTVKKNTRECCGGNTGSDRAQRLGPTATTALLLPTTLHAQGWDPRWGPSFLVLVRCLFRNGLVGHSVGLTLTWGYRALYCISQGTSAAPPTGDSFPFLRLVALFGLVGFALACLQRGSNRNDRCFIGLFVGSMSSPSGAQDSCSIPRFVPQHKQAGKFDEGTDFM